MENNSRSYPDQPISRGEWIAVAVVVALALIVRLIYLYQIKDHALFSCLTGDPALYEDRALGILDGILAPEHPFFHSSPLYPFFLALIFRLAGPSLHAVQVVQACVGCISVFLIFLLARLTVGRRAGLVASFLAAIYVPFIFFEGEILEISLVMAFLSGMLILLVLAGRGLSTRRAAAAGVLLGLAALGKPNLLLFAPVGAFWLASQWPRGPTLRPIRSRVLPAALFFVTTGAVILPATIHNYRTSGDLIPVSSNGGINLYIGNHPGALGAFTVPPEMRFDLRVASQRSAERALARSLSAGEVSDYWAAEALKFMRGQPGEWLGQMGRKLALFWNHYEIPNHYNLYFVATLAPVLRIPLGTFAVVAPLGVLGIALALIRKKGAGVLAAFGVTFMLSVVIFFITSRYRLAISLVLLPGAGFAIHELLDMLGRRSWKPFAASVAALVILVAGINARMIEFSFSPMYNTVGVILASQGKVSEAADEFTKALEADPSDLSPRYNLGLALLKLGRYGDAMEQFHRVIEAHPLYYEAWLGLGKAYAGQGLADEALQSWRKLLSLNPPPPPQIEAEAMSLVSAIMAPQGQKP